MLQNQICGMVEFVAGQTMPARHETCIAVYHVCYARLECFIFDVFLMLEPPTSFEEAFRPRDLQP